MKYDDTSRDSMAVEGQRDPTPTPSGAKPCAICGTRVAQVFGYCAECYEKWYDGKAEPAQPATYPGHDTFEELQAIEEAMAPAGTQAKCDCGCHPFWAVYCDQCLHVHEAKPEPAPATATAYDDTFLDWWHSAGEEVLLDSAQKLAYAGWQAAMRRGDVMNRVPETAYEVKQAEEILRLEDHAAQSAALQQKLDEATQDAQERIPAWMHDRVVEGIKALRAERDEALRKYREAMIGLESLTPSGSEFVGDVKRCIAFVKDSQHSQHQVIIQFKRAKDAAECQVAELREQLKLSERKVGCALTGLAQAKKES